LEESEPPLEGRLDAPVTLRSRPTLPVNPLHPHETHRARFSDSKRISWMDG